MAKVKRNPTVIPYLYYEDVERALRFLMKAFGFRRFGAAMRGPEGKLSHAAVSFGGGVIMLGRPPGTYRNPKKLGSTTQCLYVEVPDVDRHHAKAIRAGAKELEKPTDTEYGHRRCGVTDPEGHEWYFGAPIERRRARKE